MEIHSSIALIAKNSADEIKDALRLALKAREPRSALAVLMGLRGVGTPMASAILTATDQERYTVIDYRALESLGASDQKTDLNFYIYTSITISLSASAWRQRRE